MPRSFRFLLPLLALLVATPAVAETAGQKALKVYEATDNRLTTLQKQLENRLAPAARKKLAAAHDAWLEFRGADGEYMSYGLNDTSDVLIARGAYQAKLRNDVLAWYLGRPSTKAPVLASEHELDLLEAAEKREKAAYKSLRNHLDPDQMELLIKAELAWQKYRDLAGAPDTLDYKTTCPNASHIAFQTRLTESRTQDLQAEIKRLRALPG